MKKLSIALFMFMMVNYGFSQYSLTFCENVNNEGKPYKASGSFMISPHGSVLKFLVKSDSKLNTDQMDFRIFYINDLGKEEEVSQLPQKVEPGWNYTWKEVVFFDP